MKITRVGIVLVLAASMFIMPACKKKSEDPQPEEEIVTPVTTPSFTAKVDGTAVTYPVNAYTQNGGHTIIIGTSPVGTSITLNANAIVAGTYTINSTTISASYYNTSKTTYAVSGQIVISKIENSKISGTFNFVTDAGAKITEGVFANVALQ
jgi:hypothetical protein